MRIVFFGSPEYAVPSFGACVDVGGAAIVAVVTQPDRPRGRSGGALMTAVKQVALAAGVRTILQPDRIRRDTTDAIAALHPDVGVVAASGHILPTHLLEVFPHGVVNVHASLLPRHRGASPVAAAILAGDAEAGASIMQVVRALDAGPVVAQRALAVSPLDTTGTLTDRIAELGAALLADTLPRWVAGALLATPQDEARVTYAPRLTKDDGVIDWTRPADEIARAVRAYHPWPLATTRYRGESFAILSAHAVSARHTEPPGTVVEASRGIRMDAIVETQRQLERTKIPMITCGEGVLVPLVVQRAGRRETDIRDYVLGDRDFLGSVLG